MTEGARLLLAALALYRLARLVALEEGPAGLFERLRGALGAWEYGEEGFPKSNLGRGAVCPFCWGLWLSPLFVALVLWPTLPGDLLVLWLGLAGAAAFLQARE